MYLDPTCILLPPRHPSSTVTESWLGKIVVALATRFETSPKTVSDHLRAGDIERWGKVRRLGGGDDMNASSLVPLAEDRRDATYVRVSAIIVWVIELADTNVVRPSRR